MKQAGSRRGAVLVQVVVVLAIVLVALAVWRTVARLDAIDAASTPFKDKLRGETYKQLIGLLLFPFAIAGGIGAGCYFVFGKSQRAASAGAAVPLAAVVGLLLFQVYNTYFATPKAKSSGVVAGTGSNDSGGSHGSAGGSGSTPYVVPRSATPAPTTAATSPTQGGGSSPFGTGSAPSAPVTPTAQTPPPPVPAFDGRPVLEKLRDEYGAKCEALALKAEAAYAAAAKPKKVHQFLNDSIEMFTALKGEAEAMEAEIRELNGRGAREALEKAGAPLGDAARLAMDFDEKFSTFQRQVACGEVSRFAERAAELFTIIKENFAKVQIDSKGEATSKDREVESKLFHARSHLGFAAERKDETLKKVRGKE